MKWIKAAVVLGTVTLVLLLVGAGKIDREELKRLVALKKKAGMT